MEKQGVIRAGITPLTAPTEQSRRQCGGCGRIKSTPAAACSNCVGRQKAASVQENIRRLELDAVGRLSEDVSDISSS